MTAARKLDEPIAYTLGPRALDAPGSGRTLRGVGASKAAKKLRSPVDVAATAGQRADDLVAEARRDIGSSPADLAFALGLAKSAIDETMSVADNASHLADRLVTTARAAAARVKPDGDAKPDDVALALALAARVARGLTVALRDPAGHVAELRAAAEALPGSARGLDTIPKFRRRGQPTEQKERALALVSAVRAHVLPKMPEVARVTGTPRPYYLAAVVAYYQARVHVFPSRTAPKRPAAKRGEVVLSDSERDLAEKIRTAHSNGKATANTIARLALEAHGVSPQAARDMIRK